MDRKEFIKWYEGFGRSSSLYQLTDKALDYVGNWFERTEENHKALREILGGSDKAFGLELKRSNQEITLPQSFYVEHAKTIYGIIPGYFTKYGLLYTRLAEPTVPDAVSKKRGMKWGRHIEFYLKKECPELPEDDKKKVASCIAKIGEAHARFRTEPVKFYAKISTNPKDFLHIGELIPDNASCFRFGSVNELHKFIVGQNVDTFVGIVSDKEDPQFKTNDLSIKMRFWGVAEKDYSAFHICNIYPRNPEKQGSIYRTIAETFKAIVGEDMKMVENKFRVKGVFFNKESPVTFYRPSWQVPRIPPTFKFDSDELEQFKRCASCSSARRENLDIVPVDYNFYCTVCAARCQVCDLTGEKTAKNRYSVNYNGKTIKVMESVFTDMFRKCKKTGLFYHIDEMIEDGEHFIHKDQVGK